MSPSQAKDLDQDGKLIAYVHKSGKVSYTTCQLIKAICFSPDKAKPLTCKSAVETKSPIKLRKYQFIEHFNNIVVNKKTVIQNYTKLLDFKPSENSANPANNNQHYQLNFPSTTCIC